MSLSSLGSDPPVNPGGLVYLLLADHVIDPMSLIHAPPATVTSWHDCDLLARLALTMHALTTNTPVL